MKYKLCFLSCLFFGGLCDFVMASDSDDGAFFARKTDESNKARREFEAMKSTEAIREFKSMPRSCSLTNIAKTHKALRKLPKPRDGAASDTEGRRKNVKQMRPKINAKTDAGNDGTPPALRHPNNNKVKRPRLEPDTTVQNQGARAAEQKKTKLAADAAVDAGPQYRNSAAGRDKYDRMRNGKTANSSATEQALQLSKGKTGTKTRNAKNNTDGGRTEGMHKNTPRASSSLGADGKATDVTQENTAENSTGYRTEGNPFLGELVEVQPEKRNEDPKRNKPRRSASTKPQTRNDQKQLIKKHSRATQSDEERGLDRARNAWIALYDDKQERKTLQEYMILKKRLDDVDIARINTKSLESPEESWNTYRVPLTLERYLEDYRRFQDW